jgi:WD40 repeat protein
MSPSIRRHRALAILAGLLLLPASARGDDPPPAPAPADLFRSYQAHLAAAEKSLRLGEMADLVRWLDGAPAEHRGWEWRHLRALADTSILSVPLGDPALRLVLSSDGARAATVEGSAVVLRDPVTLAETGRIAGHTDAVHRAEFSPDGARLVTVSRDRTSRVWNLATSAEIARIELPNPAVAACAFSPDGARVATSAWERDESGQVHGVVWVWDPASGRISARERVGVKPLAAIRWLPDGESIAVVSWDALVHILDPNAKELRRIEVPDEGQYRALDDLAISPDGARIAVAARDRTARIIDLASGAQLASLHGHVAPVTAVAWSPDGARLATVSADATVRIWGADGAALETLRGGTRRLSAVVWSPAGDAITAAGAEGVARRWRPGSGGPERLIRIEGTPYSAALTADGSLVALACHGGEVRIHSARDGEELAQWVAHPGSSCNAAAFDGAGARLITCSWDRSAVVWDVESKAEIARLASASGLYSSAISRDGSLAALSGAAAELWEVGTATLRHRIERAGAEPRRLDFDPAGARLAIAWTDGAATVHDCRSGERLAAFEGLGTAAECAIFIAGGAEVAIAAGGVVRIFPAAGGAARVECRTGELAIQQLAVSDRLSIIDPVRGEVVLERHLHPDSLYHASATADGSMIATCAPGDGVAILTAPAPR